MRTHWTAILFFGVVLCGTTSAVAQVDERETGAVLPSRPVSPAALLMRTPAMPDFARRLDEVATWMEEFTAWKEWAAQWGNRREPGWFTGYRQRRQRPDPPAWLFDHCMSPPDDDDATSEACTLLAEWSADFATVQTANQRVAATTGAEDGGKTTWWEHVHLDGGWPALQSGVSLYGVIGMHATTNVRGRLEIFVAPGAMLLNVPTNDGGRAWKLATNYGIAYRLGHLTFPGNRQALLHLNLVKAWLLSAGDVPTKSTDFVGLSLTFKKTP